MHPQNAPWRTAFARTCRCADRTASVLVNESADHSLVVVTDDVPAFPRVRLPLRVSAGLGSWGTHGGGRALGRHWFSPIPLDLKRPSDVDHELPERTKVPGYLV